MDAALNDVDEDNKPIQKVEELSDESEAEDQGNDRTVCTELYIIMGYILGLYICGSPTKMIRSVILIALYVALVQTKV